MCLFNMISTIIYIIRFSGDYVAVTSPTAEVREIQKIEEPSFYILRDGYELKLISRPEDFEKYNVFGEEIEEEPRYIEYNYAPDAELNFTTPSGDKMVAFCYEIYYD